MKACLINTRRKSKPPSSDGWRGPNYKHAKGSARLFACILPRKTEGKRASGKTGRQSGGRSLQPDLTRNDFGLDIKKSKKYYYFEGKEEVKKQLRI